MSDMTRQDKLYKLAEWLTITDRPGASEEVQDDVEEIADYLTTLERQLAETSQACETVLANLAARTKERDEARAELGRVKAPLEILRFAALNEFTDELLWRPDLSVSVVCSDFFEWGTADAEPVTLSTLPDLKKAVEDCSGLSDEGYIWGPLLYCARQRQLRPQGAAYKHLPRDLWELFDACGPERNVNILNPRPHPEADDE